ncbi:MAG: hypothetical protein AB9879_09680 [Methanothrix sp.]
MVTNVDPYCQIHGWDFSSIVYFDGKETSGGTPSVEEIQIPGQDYADVRSKGRAVKKYKIHARSFDREEIEIFLGEVNGAPEDSVIYPFDAERFGLIALAHAELKACKIMGTGKNLYEADAEITCREAWLYGPDQGIVFENGVTPPKISPVLANQGHIRSPITYMQCAGDYVSGSYAEDLVLRITPAASSLEHDRELVLCDKLLRDDVFELGWRGEVIHSYGCRFVSKDISDLAIDVHFLGAGMSIASERLTIAGYGYLWIPFYGPLQVAGEADSLVLELWVTSITGSLVIIATTDFSGYVATIIDAEDLVVGYNRICIPGYEGVGNVAIGVWCQTAGDSITLSEFKGTVKRYVAPSKIPWADPGEEFQIRVESSAGSLTFLQVCYNDRFWY